MACCLTNSLPTPSSRQCTWCSQIYPRERLYSRNCPRKRRQPLSTRSQPPTNENIPTLTNARHHHNHYRINSLNSKKLSTVSVYELVQTTSCGDSEMLKEILYSERFASDPQKQQKATHVLATSLYTRQFSIFNILMDFHKRFGHILLLNSATHYFAIRRHEPLLVTAARMNYVDGVQKMLQGGALVNAIDSAHRTALWTACSVKGLAMVELLLDYGADVDIADDNGFTPLMVCVRAREPSLDIIETLLRNGSAVSGLNCKRSIFTLLLHKTDGKLVRMVSESCLLTPWITFKTIQNFLLTGPNPDSPNQRKRSSQSETTYQYLKHSEYSRHPVLPSLKQQCRKVIRGTVKSCYPWKLVNGLEQLPIPKSLRLFVQMKNI